MKKNRIAVWVPTFVTIAFTVVFATYYTIFGARRLSTYLQLLVGTVVPAIFPVIGLISKRQYSLSLPISCAALCVLGIHFANAGNFYSFWPRYDIFLHTNFGLVGSAMLYAVLLRWNGGKMPLFAQFMFIFVGVLGLGALWEILEYVCSWFTGEDPQRCWAVVREAIATGTLDMNPVYDTMQDLTVTAIGSAVFMIAYFADKWIFKGKCYESLFTEPKEFEKIEKD